MLMRHLNLRSSPRLKAAGLTPGEAAAVRARESRQKRQGLCHILSDAPPPPQEDSKAVWGHKAHHSVRVTPRREQEERGCRGTCLLTQITRLHPCHFGYPGCHPPGGHSLNHV